ncbi:hypothetical protein [Adhaeribacter aquaticus]|uniref:hypothetical protein n=1 Tax=Adhaeribacter aquaticus TaxID=299567 RepID=UPI0003F9268C|nr:hypothetical protein [Adhaeribacter aquaticus]
MHKTITDFSKNDYLELSVILKERLINGRNLIYYASGTKIKKQYADLPFDNIVLVDRCFKDILSINGKVISVGLNAIQATAFFKNIGIKFDAFVCINEGLSEGAGWYSIHGNWSFSNILPIIKDEYLHIACPNSYGRRKWKKLFNLPQQAVLLGEEDSSYIDPNVFSDYYKVKGKEFCVWKVTKSSGVPVSFNCGRRKISVQHMNIWEDYEVLDVLFVRCSPLETENLKSVAPKVEFLKNYSFDQILQFCRNKKVNALGLSPWLAHNYDDFLTFLEENEGKYPYPQQITFYHLHKNDFKQLYAKAEQHQIALTAN